MDVLLDILDTFVFDRFYASVLPDFLATYTNSTLLGTSHLNQNVRAYYPLEPSPWAEASRLKRDDLLRQSLSLFLLIWFVYIPPAPIHETDNSMQQGLWNGHVPHRKLRAIPHPLRQASSPTSSLPPQPDPARDPPRTECHARHGHSHGSVLHCRNPWMVETLRLL